MEINTQRQNTTVQIGQLLPEQLKVPVRFEDVELDQNEIDKALHDAKEKKLDRLEDERKKKLALALQNDVRRQWSANELYEYARKRATEILRMESGDPSVVFEPMSWQRDAIQAISLYFANDPHFEVLERSKFNNSTQFVFSRNKGLWLWSNPGRGKTLLMTMFSRNKRQCFQVVQCPKIAGGYKRFGEEHILKYTQVQAETAQPFNFFQSTAGFCYNDLGTEPETVANYGNSINVMEKIFLDSYDSKVPFWHRHVTTNLTFDQIKQMYGERFMDRIKQCFNIIEIKGESLRK